MREFVMKEPVPLARVQDAVLGFLRGREDAMLFGAQAVNAYVEESRMTQDVVILSTRAGELAEEVRAFLGKEFTMAVRVREVAEGKGFRVYQVREPKNRHLVDVRQVGRFPAHRVVEEVRVVSPEELVAMKVMGYVKRSGQPKGGTDWRDLAILLLTFPLLKVEAGAVRACLERAGADGAAMAEWGRLVATKIEVPEEDEGY